MRVVALDLAVDEVAVRVHEIARRAYRVEAELIGTDEIPPLRESLEEMRAQPLRWLGVGAPDGFLAYSGDGVIDIDRLCVDPDHFRKGYARALLNALPVGEATVSTGALNTPAIALYEREGFVRSGSFEPVPGLVVVTFRRPGPATTATGAACGAG